MAELNRMASNYNSVIACTSLFLFFFLSFRFVSLSTASQQTKASRYVDHCFLLREKGGGLQACANWSLNCPFGVRSSEEIRQINLQLKC